VPLGMAMLGVFLFAAIWKKMRKWNSSPIEAIPVIVVDKRTEVSGGERARARYFVTCETEDGARHEYSVWDGGLYGRMAVQDAGIIYVRADFVLDFDRVPTEQ